MKGNYTCSSVSTSSGLCTLTHGRSDNHQHFTGKNGEKQHCYRAGVSGLKKAVKTSSSPLPDILFTH